jgi:hypothetical protein
MSDRISRHLRANVVGYLALFVALSGTAVAGGVLNKKKVNAIITNRAPSLSVATAANAQNATNSENLGGLPASAFAGAPKKFSVERTSAGSIDAGMFGPYDVTLFCGTGGPWTSNLSANGPAGTTDNWGAVGSPGSASASLQHQTSTTLSLVGAGTASGTTEHGATGLITTGSTLITYQVVVAVQSSPFDCTAYGTFEVSS